MVIAKTVMSADHKKVIQEDLRIFFRFQNVSYVVVSLDCSICTRREKCTRIYLCVCACVGACVRVYVCKGAIPLMISKRGRSGREIMASRDGKIV